MQTTAPPKNILLVCEDLASELKRARDFDHRLGVLLTHRSTCVFCRDSEELSEWIDQMTATRFYMQLQLRKADHD